MAQTHKLSLEDFRAHDPEGGRGGRWLCPTPECSAHTDPRRHRSVSMVEETGLWNCKRCKAQGQLTERWKPFAPKSRKEIEQEASRRRRAGLLRVLASCKKPIDTAPSEKATSTEWRWRLGSLQKIQASAPALRFVEGRGFNTPEALELLTASGVRVASDFARREATEEKKAWSGALAVVFPVRDALGNLVAGQGRFTKPLENGPKCLTLGDRQAGVFATPGALEALLAGRPVAICEAPLDALSLALAGLPSVALCGSGGVPAWLTRRAFGRRFLLAFDADEAGEEAAEKLTAELRGLGGIVSRLRPVGQAKDFNEALQNGKLETLRALIAREVGGSKAAREPIGTTFATAPNTPSASTSESFEAPSGQNRPTEARTGKSVSEGEKGPEVAGSRRISQGEEDLPRFTDPEAFAAWLKYAKASPDALAPFEEWKAARAQVELAALGQSAEDELARVEESVFAGEWADVLEKLQRLPEPLAWPKSKGCFVPDVARWLQLAGERRNRLYALRGPRWAESSSSGRALAQDLTDLRGWVSKPENYQKLPSPESVSSLSSVTP